MCLQKYLGIRIYSHHVLRLRVGDLGPQDALQSLVGGALVVVILHVLERGEDSVGGEGEALAARVGIQLVGLAGEDVVGAILRTVSMW